MTAWRAVLVRGALGPAVRRPWLLEVELTWSLVVIWTWVGPPPTSGHEVSIGATPTSGAISGVLLAVLALLALARWWRPGATPALALVVLAADAVATVLRDVPVLSEIGDVGGLTFATVVFAAGIRRSRWPTGVVLVLLVVAGAVSRVADNVAEIDLGPALGDGPRPIASLAFVFAVLGILGPLAVGLLLRASDQRRRAEALARVRAEERLAVARDLHDTVANHVTGIVVRAQAAALTEAPTEAGRRSLAEIESAGHDALRAMRRMVGVLRSEVDGELPALDASVAATDLSGALRNAIGETDAVRVALDDGLESARLAPDVVATVHRVVVEALTNVRRHAPGATRVQVSASAPTPGAVVLEIANDGVAGRRAHRDGGGFGTVGMRERVVAVGGRLDVGPDGPGAWRVRAEFPT